MRNAMVVLGLLGSLALSAPAAQAAGQQPGKGKPTLGAGYAQPSSVTHRGMRLPVLAPGVIRSGFGPQAGARPASGGAQGGGCAGGG
jgi:hypothetical protein